MPLSTSLSIQNRNFDKITLSFLTFWNTLFLFIQVILVGHDFGGACIAYAMELFPFRIAKAIFIAAAMLTNGQNTLDMFSQQVSLIICC